VCECERAKLSTGEDMSRCSNKLESVGLGKCPYITILLRNWCRNNRYFSELAPHHGGKTAGMKKSRHFTGSHKKAKKR